MLLIILLDDSDGIAYNLHQNVWKNLLEFPFIEYSIKSKLSFWAWKFQMKRTIIQNILFSASLVHLIKLKNRNFLDYSKDLFFFSGKILLRTHNKSDISNLFYSSICI